MSKMLDRAAVANEFKAGRIESALSGFRKLHNECPEDSSLAIDLAICEGQLGNSDAAIDLFEKVLAEDAFNDRAMFYCGLIHFKNKKFDAAKTWFERMPEHSAYSRVAAGPHIETLISLSDLENANAAILRLGDGLAAPYTHFLKGKIAERKGFFDLAYREYLIASAEGDDSRYKPALARMCLALGKEEEAKRLWAECHFLNRKKFRESLLNRAVFTVKRDKLEHDLLQCRYLLRKASDRVAADYASALEDILRVSDQEFVEIRQPMLTRISPFLNQPFHMLTNGRCGDVLSSSINWKGIDKELHSGQKRLFVIDNALDTQAITYLRRLCAEATIWYDDKYENGYVAAYLDDGLASGFTIQFSQELVARLSLVLGQYALSQAWAFKYVPELEGVAAHADFARWTANLWISPDVANMDPKSGGLVLFEIEPSDIGWIRDHKDGSDGSDLLQMTRGYPIRIPYRGNRLIFFDSSIVHATDRIAFTHDYGSRRVNLTLLYGYR